MLRGCKYRENRVGNCSSCRISIPETLWAILHHGRLGKTFYQLAEIDEESVSLEIFRNRVQKYLSGIFWFLLLRRAGLRDCGEAPALHFCDFPVSLSTVPGRNSLISTYSFTRMSIS